MTEEIQIQPLDSQESAGQSSGYLPRVAKGAMINLSGTAVRTIMNYVYAVLLAHLLSVSALGQYFLIVTVINILGLACAAGLNYGVVRYVALYAGEGRYDMVRRMLASSLMLGVPLGLAGALLVILLAPWLANTLLGGDPSAGTAVRVFAISLPFWVAALLFNATTQGLHRMRYQVLSRDVGEQVSKLVFSILVLSMGFELIGVVWANVASIVLAMVLSGLFALIALSRPPIAKKPGRGHGRSGKIFRYSFPLAFSNVLGMALVWIDMLLMGYLGNTTDAGFYGAVLKVSVISSAIFLALATVFTPVISDLYNRHQVGELLSLYKTITRWTFMCTLPVVLLQFLFPDALMNIFGDDFVAGSTALMIIACSQIINAVAGPSAYMVLMSGRSKLELINILVSLIVNIVTCFLLIPSYGLVGAALANLAGTVVINLMRAVEVWFFMRMHAYDYSYLKPVFAGVVAASLVGLERIYLSATALMQVTFMAATLLAAYVSVTLIVGLNSQDTIVLGLVKKRVLGKA